MHAESAGGVHQPLDHRAARDLPPNAMPAEATDRAGAAATGVRLRPIGATMCDEE